jgi:hypothetical protein
MPHALAELIPRERSDSSRILAQREPNSWSLLRNRFGVQFMPRACGSVQERGRLRRDMNYNIEFATTRSVSGWCIGPDMLVGVRCLQDSRPCGQGQVRSQRPDVQSVFPECDFALHSGFAIHFETPLNPGEYSLEFQFADGTGSVIPFSLQGSLELPTQCGIARENVPEYLLFLRTSWHRFLFLQRHFPKYNERVRRGSKDELCILTGPQEMLHIADQLYRLTKTGLIGPVCEFGCFKGFSTCCLSHVCFDLGLRLEVFDSFAGLPEVNGSYYRAGDFYGALDEVAENVRTFGRINLVTFNKGFFSESLPGRTLDPILIWMDVDLRSSSRDVMTIAGQLPKESCVMSHECFARNFDKGRIIPDEGEGDVITPIVEAMARESRPITGTWLTGGLGAFWTPGVSVTPLPNSQLNEALKLASG